MSTTHVAREVEKVKSSDLRIGDVVYEHNMVLRLVSGGESSHRTQYGPVFSFRGVVLNPERVRADKIVPWSWLIDNPDGEPRWTVQGNDRVSWWREVA